MEIKLKEIPKGVTIIQGFPGFGMVGSISTEYLIEHMAMELIGTVQVDEIPPMIAVHKGKLIPQIGVYFSKEHNVVVLHFLVKGQNHEWLFGEIVERIAKRLDAKEVISLEGVSGEADAPVYGYSNRNEKKEELEQKGFPLLNESIILGVSAALLVNDTPITAFFAMTKSTLPDSTAAAEIIKSLDKYLGLSVDYDPLYGQAKEFENKIKDLFAKSQGATKEQENSMLNYMG